MRHPGSWLSGSLLATLLGVATPAAADPAAAELLFDEGVRLAARGDLQGACRKFEASEAVDVAVGTLLRLADCYERTGRLASAWSRFREAASLARTQSMDDRQRIATIRADALSPRMARLRIHAPLTSVPNLRIVLGEDEVPQASWDSPLPVNAGSLVLEASAPGYLPYRREVVVPAVDGAVLDVTVPPLERTLPVTTTEQPTTRSITVRSPPVTPATEIVDHGYATRVVGATFAVLGGMGLATSGVLTVLAKRHNDASLADCPDDKRHCTALGVQKRREAIKLANAATVSVSVGGGLLLTGLIVYWVAPKPTTERVSIGFAPDPLHRGGSLRLEGAF